MPYHLYICRHAQAQNPVFNQPDFDRQLTKQGILEAEEAGKWLQKMNTKPDLLITSSARRTWSTTSIIADKLSYNQSDISAEPSLYNASESKLLAFLSKINKNNRAILLVGHNPGVSDLVSTLSGTYQGNVATGSVHYLTFDLQVWEEIFVTSANHYEAHKSSTF